MAGRYLTADSFKKWARDEVLVDEDMIDEAIEAAEQTVDDDTGRRFQVAAEPATERLFVPPCGSTLRIYDCTTVTAVVDNGSTLSTSEYQLEPVNGLTPSGQSVPYDSIRRLGGFGWSLQTYDGTATVAVTATWGWASIPSGIVTAARIIAQDVLGNRDVRFGIVAATDAAAFSARENKTVRTILNNYMGYHGVGLA